MGKCQIFPRPPSTHHLSTLIIVYTGPQPIGTPRGAKNFLRGGQMFLTMSSIFKYVQHIFPEGGENFSREALRLRACVCIAL